MKTILSLFDHSGGWSQPYWDAGYDVMQFDLKHGHDIRDFSVEYLIDVAEVDEVHGILSAPPCTDFALSGARWWKGKDESGETQASIDLVYQVLACVEYFQPDWWALENPKGRISKLVPALQDYPVFYFDPCDFGDPYTKRTGIWGRFTPPLPLFVGGDWSVEPTEGSKMHRLYGGKSDRTEELRSITPQGFAKAFFAANP